jgi:transcriptional regulator with XRE-family HTH domain
MRRRINRNLRAARLENFWTTEEAARQVGVCHQTYLRWEHREQSPHVSSLALLSEAFGKRPKELGFGTYSDRRDRNDE